MMSADSKTDAERLSSHSERRCHGVSPVHLSEFEASVTDISRAMTLPPKVYTDQAFYEFEIEAVWDRGWICVGRVDQIPKPGDYFTKTLVGGEPVIVARDNQNGINVISAVCQHRGMCVMAPAKRLRADWFVPPPECSGNTGTFRCPYHWWTYDLRGRLIGAPDMHHREGFDRSQIALPPLAVEVWQGFIFASFDINAVPLAPRLEKATKLLENYHLEEMLSTPLDVLSDVPFNWKLMVENFMEGYHNDRLHHDLYDVARGDNPKSEEVLSGHIDFGYDPGDAAIIGRATTAFRDRGLNPTQRALFPAIETLAESERWQMVYFCVPPSLLVGVSTDSAFWFVLTPTGPESHILSMSYVFPQSTTEMKLFQQLFKQHVAGVDCFNNEDLAANHATQIGLRSRFAPRGPLAKGDLFLVQFNSWLLDRYRESESRQANADKTAPSESIS